MKRQAGAPRLTSTSAGHSLRSWTLPATVRTLRANSRPRRPAHRSMARARGSKTTRWPSSAMRIGTRTSSSSVSSGMGVKSDRRMA